VRRSRGADLHMAQVGTMNRLPIERCRACDTYCDGCAFSKVYPSRANRNAMRGIVNGAVAGVILWAVLAVFLFYAFRVSI
jgi:hypothetical protein